MKFRFRPVAGHIPTVDLMQNRDNAIEPPRWLMTSYAASLASSPRIMFLQSPYVRISATRLRIESKLFMCSVFYEQIAWIYSLSWLTLFRGTTASQFWHFFVDISVMDESYDGILSYQATNSENRLRRLNVVFEYNN
jgi:hypothetical protein